MTKRSALSAVLATVALMILAGSSEGKARHHRHFAAGATPPPTQTEAPARPFMFYPQDIEGGVSGNLPFNNQIRKHTDPLNANGSR